MGRHAGSWKLEWRRGIGYVRFTHQKRPYLISTGKRDARDAGEEAARIYSRIIGGGVARPASTRTLVAVPLKVVMAEWLATLAGVLDAETVKTYGTIYVRKHWLTHFDSLDAMCSKTARDRYRSARLQKATVKTVKKECWAMDKFLRWCEDAKLISEAPARIRWEKTVTGTRTGKQRAKAQNLTREQVEGFLAALPEWFKVGKRAYEKKPYPIQGRFVFMYETSLRPATLHELRWGDWLGSRLAIRDEIDKTRFGREVPLSQRAQATLKAVREGARERGLRTDDAAPIFGKHLYLKTIAKAAKAAGLKTVAPYDLRHARATHIADRGGPLTGISYLLGHKQVSTTSRYLHGSERAAIDALSIDAVSGYNDNLYQEQATGTGGDRRVSNPRQLEPQGIEKLAESIGYGDGVAAENRRKPQDAAPILVQDQESQTLSEFVRDRVREALPAALRGDELATVEPLARAARALADDFRLDDPALDDDGGAT